VRMRAGKEKKGARTAPELGHMLASLARRLAGYVMRNFPARRMFMRIPLTFLTLFCVLAPSTVTAEPRKENPVTELQSIFAEFAEACVGKVKGDGDIAYPNKLKRKSLDYSTASLKEIDAYLEFLFNKKGFSDREYSNTVLWCGAYVGEVIRRNAKRKYVWMDYDDYMKKTSNPKLRNIIPLGFTTRAFLVTGKDTMTMPVNKIARFLDEGPENNIYFYASAEIKGK